MADENLPDFICPECDAGVELDWKACPSCGVELLPPADHEPAAQPEPAKVTTLPSPTKPGQPKLTAPPAPAPLAKPKAAPPPPPFDDVDTLDRDVEVAGAARSTSPLKIPATPARRRAGRILRPAGIGLVLVGAAGALVVLNWDTWVLGAHANSIGTLQLISTGVMAGVAAVGAVLYLRGRRKRKPTAAAA